MIAGRQKNMVMNADSAIFSPDSSLIAKVFIKKNDKRT